MQIFFSSNQDETITLIAQETAGAKLLDFSMPLHAGQSFGGLPYDELRKRGQGTLVFNPETKLAEIQDRSDPRADPSSVTKRAVADLK